MRIEKYTGDQKNIWDAFVKTSKNGTFLFQRDYMDYHRDRFVDHSLLVYDQNQLIALLPANIEHKTLHSHQGLTYGAIIIDDSMTTPKILLIFHALLKFFIAQDIQTWYYKTIPSIYYKNFSDEDKYALFLVNAKLQKRDVLTVIERGSLNNINMQQRRKRAVAKAEKQHLCVKQTSDFKNFWGILSENLLTKHSTKPAHSADEMIQLANQFPENIKLFCCYHDQILLAGVLIYETPQVAHAQYIASTAQGRTIGALDLLFSVLLKEIYTSKIHFDFGISNEKNGYALNGGLIEYKEGFGGRAVIHDCYKLDIISSMLSQLENAIL